MTAISRRLRTGLVLAVLVLAACTGEGFPDVSGNLPDVTRPDATVHEATVPEVQH